jgi:hypothetical protein
MSELLTVDPVTITQEIGWCGVVREGVDDLLGYPVGGGALSHIEVDDPPSMVGEHDKEEEWRLQLALHHRQPLQPDREPTTRLASRQSSGPAKFSSYAINVSISKGRSSAGTVLRVLPVGATT